MESIRHLYKIGNGPSSSHTMGPYSAAIQFKERNPEADAFRVTLYGSLAATGKGHLTDKAIEDALVPIPVEFIWKPEITLSFHPNGMLFEAFKGETQVDEWTIFSIGGGDLANRICCGNGIGTPFGFNLRSRLRIGSGSLHRT
jgi:Serine dehydratase beta chain.